MRCVHKILRGYGEAWQFSVFFCVLKDIDRVRLQIDLEEQMNQKEDRAMILYLGSNEKNAREAATVIGQPLPEQDIGIVVI